MTATITNLVLETFITGTAGLATALGAAAVISLIGFLVVKELAGASNGTRPKAVSEYFLVGIVPLLIVFGLIVVVKCMETIS